MDDALANAPESVSSHEWDSRRSSSIGPADPDAGEIALDDPVFAAECRTNAVRLLRAHYERLCTPIVTKSQLWGRIYRVDIEHSDPTGLPYFYRLVCWKSADGHMQTTAYFPDTALFPDELTPPSAEQREPDEARLAAERRYAALVREILLAEWAPMAVLEAARPGAFDRGSDITLPPTPAAGRT